MKTCVFGNTKDFYIDPKDCSAYVDYTKAVNYKDVKLDGVNNLIIRRNDSGEMKIIQAGGYDKDRGMFVDMY